MRQNGKEKKGKVQRKAVKRSGGKEKLHFESSLLKRFLIKCKRGNQSNLT